MNVCPRKNEFTQEEKKKSQETENQEIVQLKPVIATSLLANDLRRPHFDHSYSGSYYNCNLVIATISLFIWQMWETEDSQPEHLAGEW